MEELSAGIRELHDRVKHLDEQLRERGESTDLHERLGAAAMDAVDRMRPRLRWLWICGAVVALVWTPATAWGAIYFHEVVRNNCYPAWVIESGQLVSVPIVDHWYCNIFPGTSPHRMG